MKKFLVLYHSTTEATEQMASATPEQAKAGMDAWMAWAKKAGSAIVDLGMPLGNSLEVRTTSSGPGAGGIAGFSLLQAESGDAVTAILTGHPHLMMPGTTIEVLECLPIPGM